LNGATERDWAGELEAWLQKKFAECCERAGQRRPLSGLRVGPPLAAGEAKYFLLGLEEGLFRLNQAGQVESKLLPALGEGAKQTPYQMFGPDDSAPRLWREAVCQLATASSLILKRGWLKSHVTLEPGSSEHRPGALGFDLLVRSPAGKALVWVEVRRSAVELQKLIVDLRACSRRGSHSRQDCGFPQNHPRYEFGLSQTPDFLWAVAPDADICLRMTYEHETMAMELEELASLPPRSLIE
jgi:hypothetical protein